MVLNGELARIVRQAHQGNNIIERNRRLVQDNGAHQNGTNGHDRIVVALACAYKFSQAYRAARAALVGHLRAISENASFLHDLQRDAGGRIVAAACAARRHNHCGVGHCRGQG
jgi:hypothetical protein